jgi:hypothetical protein
MIAVDDTDDLDPAMGGQGVGDSGVRRLDAIQAT